MTPDPAAFRGLHAGIFGRTNSGKTFLAKHLCGDFERRGRRCLVLDPFNDVWPASFQCRNIENFIAKAKASRNCSLFVDETGQLDFRNPEHEWLLTGARHWGHITHVIGQSGMQLSPLQRSCITRLFLFRSTEETADYWRKAFVEDEIRKATKLTGFQYLYAVCGGKTEIQVLTPPT